MKHQNVFDKTRSYTQNKAKLSKNLYAKKHSELQTRATELAGDTPMNTTETAHESQESTLFDTAFDSAIEGIEKAVAYVSEKSPLAKKASNAVKRAIAVEEEVVRKAKKYIAAARKNRPPVKSPRRERPLSARRPAK